MFLSYSFKSIPPQKRYKGTLKRDNGQIIPNSPRAVGIVPTVGGQIETGYHKDLFHQIEDHKAAVAKHSRGKSMDGSRRYISNPQKMDRQQLNILRAELDKEKLEKEKLKKEIQMLKNINK